jgi:superfamily II DNA or RNA helicase
MQRVESVTIHQRADIDRLHDGHVYNFEVDEHHTYVANGIVTHNCHHTLKDNTWGKAVRLFTNAKGLGVTACPARADGMGLGRHADGLIDAMVIGTSMRWLIDNGALSDYEFACPESDMIVEDSDFAPSGDLSPAKGRVAAQKSHIVGDVVEQYVKRAPGRRAICFATDVETANDMAARFTAVGVPAASVSAKSDAGYRREMIKRFKSGIIHVLVNVDLFDEGFDLPACDVVIMARPTGSLNKYLQMCGRAMRRDPANPGKIALIIDHVSNFKRHLMPDKPHAWTLDRREKRAKKAPDPDDIPLTACRECSRPYERALPACPYCGAVPPAPEGARTLEQVDGDLVLLDRDTLARLRAAAEMESPAAIEGRVSAVAGPVAGRGAANRQMDKISARAHLDLCVAQWAAVRRTMGEDDRVIHRRLYLATGMSLLEMQAQDRQTMERFAGVVESWYQ